MLKCVYSKQAQKALVKLERSDKKMAIRIATKIIQLSKGEIVWIPLQGASSYSKLRIGNYRVISTKKENMLLVFIIEKRWSVYETFQRLLKNTQ